MVTRLKVRKVILEQNFQIQILSTNDESVTNGASARKDAPEIY